jgi:predicted DNA-binding protein (UPF0251 family)
MANATQQAAWKAAATRYRERTRLGLPKPSDSERFWSKVDKSGDCWLWTAYRGPLGYGRFALNGHDTTAHRAAWLLSGRILLPGQVLRHYVCDNPPCVRPDHMLPGTDADNVADMVAKGRQVSGERRRALGRQYAARGDRHASRLHPELVKRGEQLTQSKLTEDDVRAIRVRFAAGGVSQAALAAEYGINQGTIWPLLRGRTWRHVT